MEVEELVEAAVREVEVVLGDHQERVKRLEKQVGHLAEAMRVNVEALKAMTVMHAADDERLKVLESAVAQLAGLGVETTELVGKVIDG